MSRFKHTYLLLISLGLLVTGALVNSCKKEDELAAIDGYLTNYGSWQLAALYVANYNGDTVKTDTLNRTCNLDQTFTFNDDHSCTYNNYSCKQGSATGNWSFSNDRLILRSDVVCQDTSKAGRSQPFTRMYVVNLGRNSMVLHRIDTLAIVKSVVRRRITQYGFIHTSR